MQELKGLYVIADASCIGLDNIVNKTDEILSAGVKIIQYRDKVNSQANRHKLGNELRQLTHKHKSLLIINDDVPLAEKINADGVHLGQEDSSIEDAREMLGEQKIIGASCYDEFENAMPVINASANYIAFGSFFPSPTKPDAPRANIELLKQAKHKYKIPVCAIGGITPQNAPSLLDAGADMIAVISAIFNASSPSRAVQEYLSLM